MLNVNGKIILNVKDGKTKEGKEYKSFYTSLEDEGTRLFISVRFAKSIPSDKLESSKWYQLQVDDGFLVNDSYNKKPNLTLVITKATTLKSGESQSQAKEDIPF